MNSSYGRGALVKRRSESSRPFVEREWRTLEMDCEESEALGRPDGTGMLCLRSFRTALMGAFLFLEEWFPLGIAPEHAERQQRRTVAVRSYCLGGAKGRGGGGRRQGISDAGADSRSASQARMFEEVCGALCRVERRRAALFFKGLFMGL